MNILKKLIAGTVVVTAVFHASFAWGATPQKPQTLSTEEQNARAAIVLINHINWVVNSIKHTNDVRMLELEYERISANNLNLQTIKDEETIAQIKAICEHITYLRIQDGERKMLKRELDYNLDNAIYDAFPSPGAIVAADPWAIAYNLVQSSVSSYMNYKRAVAQLKIQHERKMWNLQAADMRQINVFYMALLDSQWSLIKKYDLNDYWRVPEKSVQELLMRLNNPDNETNPEQLFDYLNHEFQRKKYQKLPAYWYYLGVYAEKMKKNDIALEAYNRYQLEFCQILRHDRMAASVAMNKTLLLLRGKYDKKEVLSQLQIIEKNAPDDWTFLYFCASIYLDNLKDKTNSAKVLDHAINLLRFNFQDTMRNCRKLCKDNNLRITDHTFPNAAPLIACQVLQLRAKGTTINEKAIRAMLDKFKKESGSNCFGVLSFYGKLPFEYISEYLRKELRWTFVDYQYDNSKINNPAPYRLVLYMPLSWYYAGSFDIDMIIHFDDGTNPLAVKLHPRYKADVDPEEDDSEKEKREREAELKKYANPAIIDNEMVRYVFDCPRQVVSSGSPERIEILLKHPMYPVSVFFDATGLKKATTRDVNKLRMHAKSATYKKKSIQVR